MCRPEAFEPGTPGSRPLLPAPIAFIWELLCAMPMVCVGRFSMRRERGLDREAGCGVPLRWYRATPHAAW